MSSKVGRGKAFSSRNCVAALSIHLSLSDLPPTHAVLPAMKFDLQAVLAASLSWRLHWCRVWTVWLWLRYVTPQRALLEMRPLSSSRLLIRSVKFSLREECWSMYGLQRRKEPHLDCQLSSRHTSRKDIQVFLFLIFKWWHYLYGIILAEAFWDTNVLHSQGIESYIWEMIYQMQHKLRSVQQSAILCRKLWYIVALHPCKRAIELESDF